MIKIYPNDLHNKLIQISYLLIEEKFNLELLLPKHLQSKFVEYSFISGGCIYSLFNNQEPKDYDFFLKDKNFANELIEFFKSQEGAVPFKNLYQGTYNNMNFTISKYAISLGKYQIVTKYTGEPEEVVNQFDFKHNMFYYDNFEIHNVADWSQLSSNKLEFNDGRVRDITGTILRLPKFIKRGMVISKKEIAKMLNKLQENGFDEREQEILRDYTTY